MKRCFVFISFFCLLFLLSSYALGATCSLESINALGLKDEALSQGITFTKAEIATKIGTADVAEHCAIAGKIWPEIGFSIRIPTTWNGKFVMLGCGGACGSIVMQEGQMGAYLNQGYAVAADDSGHSSPSTMDWSFAYNPPSNTNPNAEQKLKDHGYRSIHETTVLAKSLINAIKGSNPTYSYYVGGSTGGRQGLMNAQRYPKDFNGWLVSMPVRDITGNAMMDVWKAVQFYTTFPSDASSQAAKLAILANKIYDKCDALDGVKDGLIDDPRKCTFNPLTDLPPCTNDVDANNCFTSAQRAAIKKIYEGPKNAAGDLLFPGLAPGGEPVMPSFFGAPSSGLSTGIAAGLGLGGGFQQYVVMKDPSFNVMAYNWETDPPKSRAQSLRDILDATKTDLSEVKNRGGKIILWHGWADTLVTPFQSIYYYEDVLKTMGDAATKSFFKLYMLPGHGHGFGIGPVADFFPNIVNWVEKGEEPGKVIATRTANANLGLTAMTRPLCPYPQVARYKGTGDINDASNFTCTDPLYITTDSSGVTVTSFGIKEGADLTLPSSPHPAFTPFKAIEFTAEGVTGNMNASVDFGTLPSNPVIYKSIGTSWKQIYPTNQCNGVSNVKLTGTKLEFTIQDNSECDLDATVGKIKDPIVLGNLISDDGGGSKCFIATAAFGSYLHPYVYILRAFRDRYLLTNGMGKSFVNWYYEHSPRLARFIEKHPILRYITVVSLMPAVSFAYISLKIGIPWSLLALSFLIGITVFLLFHKREGRAIVD
ncbi:MAG: tannase/feruloyl esterase family alpha/beta hydrolase [Syntrophorhabdaceae bacterium]|nr:tannase/feruloyl esterase family alpha/beta hydrolase [Syntrophorhabdaceae bacterium]